MRDTHRQDADATAERVLLELGTHKITTVASDLGIVGFGLTASPDGRTILYTRTDSSVDDLMLVENFR